MTARPRSSAAISTRVNMPAKRSLKYAAAIVGVCLLLTEIWAGLRLIPASRGYSVRAAFAKLPASDREFEQWLRNQPGVVRHTARVRREGQVVRFSWIMTQNVAGDPRTPDLPAAWRGMGYSNPTTVDWDWRDK